MAAKREQAAEQAAELRAAVLESETLAYAALRVGWSSGRVRRGVLRAPEIRQAAEDQVKKAQARIMRLSVGWYANQLVEELRVVRSLQRRWVLRARSYE